MYLLFLLLLFFLPLLLLSGLLYALPMHGQLPHTFTQYTTEDGLSQKTVQCVLQDRKGLIWMATWDGLYKFDGYTFKGYKANPGDSIELGSNRITYILGDRYGYIWTQADDARVYRFDPREERFTPIDSGDYQSRSMTLCPDGDVWVSTYREELLHITTHPVTHELTQEEGGGE